MIGIMRLIPNAIGGRSEQGTHECGHSEQGPVHVGVEDAHDSEQGRGDITERRGAITKEEGIQREIPHKRLVLVLDRAPQQKREKGEEPQTRFASILPAELVLWEGELVQEVQSNDVHGDRVGDQPDIIPVLNIAHRLERADDDHGQKAVQREDPVETQESTRQGDDPKEFLVGEVLRILRDVRLGQNGDNNVHHVLRLDDAVAHGLHVDEAQNNENRRI